MLWDNSFAGVVVTDTRNLFFYGPTIGPSISTTTTCWCVPTRVVFVTPQGRGVSRTAPPNRAEFEPLIARFRDGRCTRRSVALCRPSSFPAPRRPVLIDPASLLVRSSWISARLEAFFSATAENDVPCFGCSHVDCTRIRQRGQSLGLHGQ